MKLMVIRLDGYAKDVCQFSTRSGHYSCMVYQHLLDLGMSPLDPGKSRIIELTVKDVCSCSGCTCVKSL
jgi:hypothetical protein